MRAAAMPSPITPMRVFFIPSPPQPKFPRISIYTLHRCTARKSSYNFMKFVC